MNDNPKPPAEIPFPKIPEIRPEEEPKPIYQPGPDPEIPPEKEPIEQPSPKEIPPPEKSK